MKNSELLQTIWNGLPLSSPSPKRELETCSTTPEGFLPTMVDETFLESEKNHQDNPYKNRSNNPGNVMYAHVTVLSIRSSINPLELGKQSRKWILYRILKRISKHVWALEPIRYQKKKNREREKQTKELYKISLKIVKILNLFASSIGARRGFFFSEESQMTPRSIYNWFTRLSTTRQTDTHTQKAPHQSSEWKETCN